MMFRLFFLLCATFILSACATTPPSKIDSFISLAADDRVRYERGSENAADQVATLLPAAIAQVEAAHGRAFLASVLVHVCGTDDCFKRFVHTPNVSAATAPEQRDSGMKRHTADHWGIDVFIFYRQALLFVNFLRQESATGFQSFIQAVQDNQDFDLAFGNAYNRPLKEAGERFRQFHSVPPVALNP